MSVYNKCAYLKSSGQKEIERAEKHLQLEAEKAKAACRKMETIGKAHSKLCPVEYSLVPYACPRS